MFLSERKNLDGFSLSKTTCCVKQSLLDQSLSKTTCLFSCKANTNICVLDIYLGQAERMVYQKKKRMNLTFALLQKRKEKE
jgi:hypothetical protein